MHIYICTYICMCVYVYMYIYIYMYMVPPPDLPFYLLFSFTTIWLHPWWFRLVPGGQVPDKPDLCPISHVQTVLRVICQPYKVVLPPRLTVLVTRGMRYRGRFKLNRPDSSWIGPRIEAPLWGGVCGLARALGFVVSPPPVVVPLVFAIFEGMQEHRPSLQTWV